jgi:hypothetical protein
MIQYLRDESDRLKDFKGGIEKHPEVWSNNSYTPVLIQTQIDLLDTKEKQIDGTKKLLHQQQIEARALQQSTSRIGDEIENYVYAYHPHEPEKLLDYGLAPRKAYTKKQVPSTKPVITITDDVDREGFILTVSADPDAEMYDWQKGVGADPTRLDIIPAMALLKTTKKLSFVDDDVVKGTRVFYKVRAVNNKGEGPWSEAVSRVQ